MFVRFKIICVHNDIDFNFDSINVAKSKCDNLNMNITTFHKVFQSKKMFKNY